MSNQWRCYARWTAVAITEGVALGVAIGILGAVLQHFG